MTRTSVAVFLCAVLAACVTVNVYFPAAAAERAADAIIQDIYGGTPNTAPALPPEGEGGDDQTSIIDWLIPAAYAQQPDINISTPAIQTLKADMEQRHQSLLPYYQSGAIGMTRNGTLDVVDAAKVDLRARNTVKQLVADENNDRNRLYAEIAAANGHPEWERDIRDIFASRWIGNAPGGWWYQGAAGWQQK